MSGEDIAKGPLTGFQVGQVRDIVHDALKAYDAARGAEPATAVLALVADALQLRDQKIEAQRGLDQAIGRNDRARDAGMAARFALHDAESAFRKATDAYEAAKGRLRAGDA